MRLRLLLLGLSRFAHYVFDLDGTLVDSSADLVAATNAALLEVGLPALAPETVLGFVGNGVRRLVAQSVTAAGGADALCERVLAEFLAHYEEHLLDQTRPYRGVIEALDALRSAGSLVSVLTNKPGPLARRLLTGLGVGDRFFAVVGGEEGFPPKPDPGGARELLARSAVLAARTVLVGDSPIDVRTARAAGTAACAVSWGFSPRSALSDARPDLLIDDPAELIR